MKQIQVMLFAVMALVSMAGYGQESATEEQKITDLIKNLAVLTDLADGCGEQMNYYGKKALEGKLCKQFKSDFSAQWPSREALQDVVVNYTSRLNKGTLECDHCRLVLQRVEELRITLIYYLDYMDYMKEM